MSEALTMEGRGGYRRVLANPRFRRLWVAQFVSGVGDWLVIGFLIPLVTSLSGGSSFAVAGIMIAKIVPALLFSTATGALIDRFDRRRVMIAADLTRAALTFVLLTTNSLAVIYVTVMLMETASLFFWPARNALIPRLVEAEDVAAANGLAYTTQQTSMVFGLSASGAVLAGFEAIVRALLAADVPLVSSSVGLFAPALLGPRAGVFINAISFLLSAGLTSTVRVTAVASDGPRPALRLSLIGAQVRESFRFLRGHRELRGLLSTIFLAILGGGAIIPVGLVYVNDNLTGRLPFVENLASLERLAAAPQTFMLVFLAFGMASGALLAPRLGERLRLQMLFAGSVAAFGAVMLAFALTNSYALASVLAIAAGACVATVTVAGNTYVVRTTADELRGRVFTALESVIRLALLISMVVMAPLGDLAHRALRAIIDWRGIDPASFTLSGARVTLLIAAAIVTAAAVYAFRTLSWRNCEEGEPGCEEVSP